MLIGTGTLVALFLLALAPRAWSALHGHSDAPHGSLSERWLAEHRATPSS